MGPRKVFRKFNHSFRSVYRDVSHIIDEYLYRIPNPAITYKLAKTTSPRIQAIVNNLRRDGIVKLDGFITGEQLGKIQESFNEIINTIKSSPVPPEESMPHPWEHAKYRPYIYDQEYQTTYTHDPFKYDPVLLELALDEFILDIIARYLCKQFMLHQAIASRYYSFDRNDFGSWQWHHDGWGKRINVMFVFTDVTENDQYMSYMKGSHRLIHSYHRTVNSRIPREEIHNYRKYDCFDCICQAGTVFIFDPNGLHRGNRSLGAYRDSLITTYNCGRYIWKFNIPQDYFDLLDKRQQAFLLNNPRINLI